MKIESASEYFLEFRASDSDDIAAVNCRWDGCVNLRMRDDDEWMHVCHLQWFIRELIKANNLAAEHFNKEPVIGDKYWGEFKDKTETLQDRIAKAIAILQQPYCAYDPDAASEIILDAIIALEGER